MGSAFHQLCPRYSGTLTPTAPTAIRLWDTFTLPIVFQSYRRLADDNESLCAMEPRLRLGRFRLEQSSNSGPLDEQASA